MNRGPRDQVKVVVSLLWVLTVFATFVANGLYAGALQELLSGILP